MGIKTKIWPVSMCDGGACAGDSAGAPVMNNLTNFHRLRQSTKGGISTGADDATRDPDKSVFGSLGTLSILLMERPVKKPALTGVWVCGYRVVDWANQSRGRNVLVR
jgi:hypothetical protein